MLPVALPLLPALLPPLLLLLLSVVCCPCSGPCTVAGPVCSSSLSSSPGRLTRRATATLAQDGSDSEAAGRASLGFGGVVVRCCGCCLPLPPSSSFPTIAEAPAPGTREHGVMESGIERSARLDGPAGWPRGSKSRAAREEGLNQKPKLDRSGSIPQRLGVSFLPFLMTGHSGGHIEIVLPGPLGGDGHVSGKVTDPGRDFTSRYETTLPQDTASYPLLVVAPPPSDRLSAVSFSTLPVVPTRGSPELLPYADGSPEPVPIAGGLPAIPAGQCPDPCPLPLANDEPREIPWEGIHPPHRVAAEDLRSRTSRGSATSAASSVRYRALEARMEAELRLARQREGELINQLQHARASTAPYEPDPEDSRTVDSRPPRSTRWLPEAPA